MSVLKSIKGALTNVQQAGTRALKKKSARKRTKSKTFAGVEGVDLDAGADLLNKFQQQWIDMHKGSESNAEAARKAYELIRAEHDQCERQNESMNQLMALVSGLPGLLKDVTMVTDNISQLETQCSDLEARLVALEDLLERQDVSTNKLHHHYQLSVYKQRKNVHLEKVKVELANDHAKKVAGYEATLQEHLRIKQEAFEEAFAKEIQHYRMYGSTQMRPLLSNSPQKVQLADISIEQDRSELDEFLRSDDHSSGTEELLEDTNVTVIDEEDDAGGYINISIVKDELSDPEDEIKDPDKTTDSEEKRPPDPETSVDREERSDHKDE